MDTERSLDGVLVQINLPSPTQTSRQIAWANVIGVTSTQKKEREKERERKKKRNHCKLQAALAYIFSLLSCEKWHTKKKKKDEKEGS